MVEQLTLNQWVLGSSPRWCTFYAENQRQGPLVKRLRLRPLTPATGVRFSHGSYPFPTASLMRFAFFCTWTISSVGQSNRLITGGSGVRVPDGPLYLFILYRGIAQLVEQRSPKPRVPSSILGAPVMILQLLLRDLFLLYFSRYLYFCCKVCYNIMDIILNKEGSVK